MQSADELVLEAVARALRQGRKVWLCTVVQTFGASPRPLGAMLALDEFGGLTGSLSGGCIEDDLLERLASGSLGEGSPSIVEYGVSPEENERFGLPCGGRMGILVEALDAGFLPPVEEIIRAITTRQGCHRRVALADGQWALSPLGPPSKQLLDKDAVHQDFGPRFQLLLVGANELARCIAEIALAMDYRVLVTDPRPERLAQWQVAGAEALAGMPDDVVRQHANDRHSIVITLTHDPRIDDMALMEALTQPLFYVGALGSARTSAKRRARLLELDISEDQLGRLHAPVGLDIGSKSAMEIAVAVMAELTQLRHRGAGTA